MSSARTQVLMSIGELAQRVGAAPSALRYWERAGLLDNVARQGGRRRYPPDAVQRVGLIRLCQDAGFGIAEIRTLLDADPHGLGTWKTLAKAKLTEVERRIARLQFAAHLLQHTLDCPAPSLSECPHFMACVSWRAEGGDPPEPMPDLPGVNGGA